MKSKPLYTSDTATFTPVYADGVRETDMVRLIADDGRAITNGELVGTCFDVKANSVSNWTDCDLPEPIDTDDEATESDYIDALNDLGVEV